jgi:hypothetical protein
MRACAVHAAELLRARWRGRAGRHGAGDRPGAVDAGRIRGGRDAAHPDKVHVLMSRPGACAAFPPSGPVSGGCKRCAPTQTRDVEEIASRARAALSARNARFHQPSGWVHPRAPAPPARARPRGRIVGAVHQRDHGVGRLRFAGGRWRGMTAGSVTSAAQLAPPGDRLRGIHTPAAARGPRAQGCGGRRRGARPARSPGRVG